jgi:threonine dehydrogenase-like Zn-dependent dehydrogenase
MRAFVITGPRESGVQDVAPPTAGPGQVVVDVERAGVCGTDVEFFTGEMTYLGDGQARFPVRIGHEWCGTVSAVGAGVDPAWLGRRTTGDTMLGCGRCHRCLTGRQHVCHDRFEIGVRRGWPGALAEQMPVPVTALHPLPDSVDQVAGALVEPGGSALRAVQAAGLASGDRVLVLGPGTIGLLVSLFALSAGAEVHLLGLSAQSMEFGRTLGVHGTWTASELPDLAFDAVIDCSTASSLPGVAIDIVEAGKRVVYIGLASTPSLVDTRTMVLKDITAVGILSASPGLAATIEAYASGSVDPTPLVCATVGLAEVADVLAGWRPDGAGPGPKVHVDPRR